MNPACPVDLKVQEHHRVIGRLACAFGENCGICVEQMAVRDVRRDDEGLCIAVSLVIKEATAGGNGSGGLGNPLEW